MAWWRKSPAECVMVIRERNRSKAGRMARLKGAAAILPPGDLLSLPGEIDERLERLRHQMPKAALNS
jgi:hypothetical protein